MKTSTILLLLGAMTAGLRSCTYGNATAIGSSQYAAVPELKIDVLIKPPTAQSTTQPNLRTHGGAGTLAGARAPARALQVIVNSPRHFGSNKCANPGNPFIANRHEGPSPHQRGA